MTTPTIAEIGAVMTTRGRMMYSAGLLFGATFDGYSDAMMLDHLINHFHMTHQRAKELLAIEQDELLALLNDEALCTS